jgi:hypothetical protein
VIEACQHCSSPGNPVFHPGHCPRVKAVEYYPDGRVRRVEFHPEPPPAPWPPPGVSLLPLLTFGPGLPGGLTPPDPELLALARQAVEAQEARKNEDAGEWARRLAADVGHLTD